MHFVRSLLPGTKLTDDENPVLMARLDSLFQILFFIVHNDLKPTPMHVNLVQTIHNLTRSKELIEILNTLGFCFGYKKMKNIDFAIAKRITSLLGPNDRVPLAPVFIPAHPISGAMDNFDHIERNLSGKGSSHDTVLVLFQNVPVNDTSPSNLNKISVRSSQNVALQLPAAHSLTGCDTLSKVGTKHAALKALPSVHLENFGTSELTEEAIDHAEHFLVDILKPKSTVKTFNELRELKYFDYKSDIDLTKLPYTSSTIRLHIARGFYQCYRWIMAPKGDITITDPPQEYAYEVKVIA